MCNHNKDEQEQAAHAEMVQEVEAAPFGMKEQ
jgi:hypothetical protein